MPRVSIGGNQFEKVALPLVLDDRYFLLEEDDGKDLWTVFTLVKGEPFVEILRNQPQEDSLSVLETHRLHGSARPARTAGGTSALHRQTSSESHAAHRADVHEHTWHLTRELDDGTGCTEDA